MLVGVERWEWRGGGGGGKGKWLRTEVLHENRGGVGLEGNAVVAVDYVAVGYADVSGGGVSRGFSQEIDWLGEDGLVGERI